MAVVGPVVGGGRGGGSGSGQQNAAGGANMRGLQMALLGDAGGEAGGLEILGAGVVDPDFFGWYVQGAWTLTGERRRWNAANGATG